MRQHVQNPILIIFSFSMPSSKKHRLQEGEQEELEFELEKLTHAEEIKTGLANASSLASGR